MVVAPLSPSRRHAAASEPWPATAVLDLLLDGLMLLFSAAAGPSCGEGAGSSGRLVGGSMILVEGIVVRMGQEGIRRKRPDHLGDPLETDGVNL